MKTKNFSSQEVKPYDLMSMEYDLFMKKEKQDGTVLKYTGYLANFKFNRFVSL